MTLLRDVAVFVETLEHAQAPSRLVNGSRVGLVHEAKLLRVQSGRGESQHRLVERMAIDLRRRVERALFPRHGAAIDVDAGLHAPSTSLALRSIRSRDRGDDE